MKRTSNYRSSRRFANASTGMAALLLVALVFGYIWAQSDVGMAPLQNMAAQFTQSATTDASQTAPFEATTKTQSSIPKTTQTLDATPDAWFADEPFATPISAATVSTAVSANPYLTGPTTQTYTYVVDGRAGILSMTTYAGLSDYQAGLSRAISYRKGDPKPTTYDFVMRDLNEPYQQAELDALVENIRRQSSNPEQQARIAISFVQTIPYDTAGVLENRITGKYPYEVLHTNTGVCQEKSELLAYLLRELGFGVAIFRFESQNHQTLGVRCAPEFDYRDSGYCFVETTGPAISTYSTGNYANIGKIITAPEIVAISGGALLDLSEEFADAQAYAHLVSIGPTLDSADYAQWQALQQEYGMEQAG